jgi:hypothetical protein
LDSSREPLKPGNEDTLADCLRRVYAYYLESLTDDHTAAIWLRDRRVIRITGGRALREAGGPVYWSDPLAASADDDRPYVIAFVDDSGDVRFSAAGRDEILALPHAILFHWDGSKRHIEI